MYNLSVENQVFIIRNYKSMTVHNIASRLNINEDNIRNFIGHAQGCLKKDIKKMAEVDKSKAKIYQDKYNKFFAKAYPYVFVL